MIEVRIEGLTKSFATPTRTVTPVNDLTLTLPAGEVSAVIGESGCGKTTLLRLLAGLETPDVGAIHFYRSDKEVARPTTAVVFQEHRLFPWMSVRRNIEVAVRHLPLDLRNQKVNDVLALTGLTEAANAMPSMLSGGMSQRVGLARALVSEPDLLLMDEAFSALDALTRRQLSDEFVRILAVRPVTTLLVTHDVTEAVLLSRTIHHFKNGRVIRSYPFEATYPRTMATPGVGALVETVLQDFFFNNKEAQ